jgi:hypothetical protein
MDTYQRLDNGFYTQLCEMPNEFNDETKQLSRELALIQLCALTDAYRVDVTSLLLRTNHVIIRKSKGSISFVDLLSLADWNAIYESIIRAEVDRFTKVAYRAWVNSLREEQIIPALIIDFKRVIHLEEIISTRNVLIHNKGLVDEEYQRRSNDWYGMSKNIMPSIGTRRTIDNAYYKAAAECVLYVISTIDQEVASAT